ncbi:protein ACCELERATED CELL DEATH 6-like [Lolium perenne]|uniref:protein ACCELERATED CELL DEATH 6-like n=1 Tax=Lolium perenne TaxID=4522 RepID=UPI003A9A2556
MPLPPGTRRCHRRRQERAWGGRRGRASTEAATAHRAPYTRPSRERCRAPRGRAPTGDLGRRLAADHRVVPEPAALPLPRRSPGVAALQLSLLELLLYENQRTTRYRREKDPFAELTKKLLEWNNDLTTQRDENGSTPLHFAAALVQQSYRGSVCSLILEANPAALYQSDNKGLFPIHVAASVGERGTIIMFLKKSTSSAGLQDTMGRTFLHIAAENNKVRIVSFVCRNKSLSWILNMQDYAGNTALHLAIQAGSLLMFCALLGNRQIHLNISNKKGQTALDISRYKIPPGLFDDQNSETRIHYALKVVHARSGNCRRDHFEENYNHQLKHTQREELKNMKESTQTLCIGAVLIATVTFGATFALPGGYRDDEHTNGGTPTLAGRYAFDAFILASTLSFITSAMSIVGLMYSGYSILNPHSRRIYFLVALYFASMLITCFMVAFALGLYMVLAPVAHKSAITIGVISPLVILCNKTEFWIKWALLARPLCTRIGLIRTLVLVTTRILFNTLMEFWPIIFIFVWLHIKGTISRNGTE